MRKYIKNRIAGQSGCGYFHSRGYRGMTLVELVIAISVASVILVVITGFTASASIQYKKQKEIIENSRKVVYVTQVFNTIDQYPEVRVRADSKALKVTNNLVSPASEIVYYEQQGSIFRDEFKDSVHRKTEIIAEEMSAQFSLDTVQKMVVISLTDINGHNWTRKISLRDCELVETY